MKVYERKPRRDEKEAVTFGSLDAVLDEDTIKTYSLRPALKRLGRALARQMERRDKGGRHEVIGVSLRSVAFDLILAKKKER